MGARLLWPLILFICFGKGVVAEEMKRTEGAAEPEQPEVLNETRYSKIMARSICPPWSLLRESIKEDHKALLPRMILITARTAKRMPLCVLMKPGKAQATYVNMVLKHWAKRVCRLAKARITMTGAERIDPDRTYLYAVNHMSPFDIPVIYACMPQRAGFVANAICSHIPVMAYWMKRSGAVFISQGDKEKEFEAVKLMVKRLKRGRSLILFPEGYIFQGEGLADFKRGGLYTAVLAGVPIVPVCIYGTQNVMPTGSLHIIPRRRVVLKFGEPTETSTLDRDGRKGIEKTVYDRLLAMKRQLAEEWSQHSHW